MLKQENNILPSQVSPSHQHSPAINWTWLIASRLGLFILALIFPPAAVTCITGFWTGDLLFNVLLCLALWIPGILHALYVLPRYENRMYVGCLDHHHHDQQQQHRRYLEDAEIDAKATTCWYSRLLSTSPATRELLASCRAWTQDKRRCLTEKDNKDVEATLAAGAANTNTTTPPLPPQLVLSPPPELLPGGFRAFRDTYEDSDSDSDIGSGVVPSLL